MIQARRYPAVWWHTYLVARDGDLCWYCGDPFGDVPNHASERTLEHLIPAMPACAGCRLSLPWNLVLAHRDCNRLAGSNRLAVKFELRDYLRAHGGHRALCNVRARFRSTDPCQPTEPQPGTSRHRRLTAKHKRAVVKAWKAESGRASDRDRLRRLVRLPLATLAEVARMGP